MSFLLLGAGVGSLAAAVAGGGTPSTFDPAAKSSYALLSLSNMKLTGTDGVGAPMQARSTQLRTSGKLYFEVTINAIPSGAVGVCLVNPAHVITNFGAAPGGDANGISYENGNVVRYNGVTGSSGSPGAYVAGDVIGVAVDTATGNVWFSKNGVFSGDPAAATGGMATALTTGVYADFWANSAGAGTINFGGSAFITPPPSGFGSFV